MKQRVAVAQALIMRPKVVLLDEPFGALDEAMREDLQYMLLRFYQENLQRKREGKRPEYTILMVTHELNEAIFVADRVIGMSRFHTEGNKGATVVYDKPCPVFHPNDARDYSKFVDQREELRRAVFDDEYIKDRNKYVTFWNDLSQTGLCRRGCASRRGFQKRLGRARSFCADRVRLGQRRQTRSCPCERHSAKADRDPRLESARGLSVQPLLFGNWLGLT